jgi:peptidoglycan hydrolase-like protein with peptidoglycan-binding domain
LIKGNIVKAAQGEVMFLASKIGLAGIAFTLLTPGMLVHDSLRSAGIDATKSDIPVFVMTNEIKKMQGTLRDKGYYEGRIDGVFGLRTRAGIRGFQKAQHLPVNGQVDARTAGRLGIRPEWNWGNSHKSAQEVGHIYKPSAGVGQAEGRVRKPSRKGAARAAAIEDQRGGANK